MHVLIKVQKILQLLFAGEDDDDKKQPLFDAAQAVIVGERLSKLFQGRALKACCDFRRRIIKDILHQKAIASATS